MKNRSSLFLITILAASVVAVAAMAAPVNDKFSLQLRLGAIQPALNDSSQVWLLSPMIGGTLQYMVAPRVGLVLSGDHSSIYDDSVGASFLRVNHDRAERKLSVTTISLGSKFYLRNLEGATPFVITRIELLFWNVKNKQTGSEELYLDRDGATKKYSATEAGITGGLGFEQWLDTRFGYSLGTEITYLTGIGTDFPESIKNSRSRALVNLSVSVLLRFGKSGKSPKIEITKQENEITPPQTSKPQLDSTKFQRVETQEIMPAVNSASDSIRASKDSDSDGVLDFKDKCADTPKGAIVDSAGCPLDEDSDGVYDGIDKCPQSLPAEHNHVDQFGCPLDQDHDGIPDYLDKCANTPNGVKVDADGCSVDSDSDGVPDGIDSCPQTPRGMPVDVQGCLDKEKIFRKRTYRNLFNSGETKLTPQGDSTLDSIVLLLKEFPTVTLTVSCFTDDLGPADANLKVSQKRAAAVSRYLEIKGINSKRLRAVGKGESDFLAPNRTRAGREKNRRIELDFKVPANLK